MDSKVLETYGHRVRVRACGLCRADNKLLLVNHSGLGTTDFWAPPGGGIEFGTSIDETIRKEFLEEANLAVVVGDFLFGVEFVKPPLHAIELFYDVTIVGGALRTGADPELDIITDVAFWSAGDITSAPPESLHGIFRYYASGDELRSLKGFYRI